MGTNSEGPSKDRPTFQPRSLEDYVREQEATEVRLLPPEPAATTASPLGRGQEATRAPASTGATTATTASPLGDRPSMGGSASSAPRSSSDADDDLETGPIWGALSGGRTKSVSFQTMLFRGLGGLVLIAVVTGIVWGLFRISEEVAEPGKQFAATIGETLRIKPEKVRVEVTLVNECPYGEEAFMVKVVPDGPTAPFRSGKAVIEAFDNQRLQIVANSNYPDFHYETNHVRVEPQMRMVANCDSAEEHLKATAESLRKAFNK